MSSPSLRRRLGRRKPLRSGAATASLPRRRLIEAARRVRPNAYAPYSRYRCGAAVLAGSGRIFSGVNVETPTLIGHVCAERNAIFSAITAGEREILAVATVSEGSEPCGNCRQMILEFGRGDIPVYSVHQAFPSGKPRVVSTSISRLMPMAHTAMKFDSPPLARKPAGRKRSP